MEQTLGLNPITTRQNPPPTFCWPCRKDIIEQGALNTYHNTGLQKPLSHIQSATQHHLAAASKSVLRPPGHCIKDTRLVPSHAGHPLMMIDAMQHTKHCLNI